MTVDTDWFRDAQWGLLCHYLGAAPSTAGGAELTAEAWNRQVDRFNLAGLVRQLVQMRPGYFFLSIGQNSGHYCAPNDTYDELVGIKPSKCSRRDLVTELAETLEPHGIRLMVYLPAGAPAADPVAVQRLGWEWGFEGGWPHGWSNRTGKRLADFQRNWEAVIREWSLRWGRLIHGWWIDGCYFADEMYRHKDEPNFASFAAALKAGNPDSLVAFNPGVKIPIVRHSEYEDYTAGEIDRALPEVTGRWVDGAQLHILTYAGANWCRADEPRFCDELVTAYTKYVNRQQGTITWDLPITQAGLVPEPFVRQMVSLARATRRSKS